MPSITATLVLSLFLCLGALAAAAPLTSATVTELKNEVRLQLPAEDRAAKVRDSLTGADVLRTGERSLAELEFNDKTITRLGSKSVFTFAGETREFRVNQGLTLICLPKGVGGAKIVTAAITAAIEGTTVLAEQFFVAGKKPGEPARPAAKLIFVEGRGVLTSPDSKEKVKIRGGQIFVHILGEPKLADPQDIDLGTLVAESGIINSFARKLPTWDAIQSEVKRQRVELRRGFLEESRFFLVGRGTQLGKRELSLPAGFENVGDPKIMDSAGVVALSEAAPCNCQPQPP